MSSGDEAPRGRDPDVLVLGASFAGIEVVRQLVRRTEGPSVRIAVVDRQAEHPYIPLVHERLCGRLAADDARLRTSTYVRSFPGVTFVQDEVTGFDPPNKEVTLASGRRIRARFVVVALGSVLAPPPDLAGAEHLHVYKRGPELSRAEAALHRVLSTGGTGPRPRVVVVGNGITGVELAGELASLERERPPGWAAPTVVLVGAGPRLLPTHSPNVGARAERALVRQGVTLELGARVVEARPGAVTLVGPDGARAELPCDLAFWAGGVRPPEVLAALGLPRTDDGWLAVGPTLQCFPTPTPTHPDIFACGDAVRIVGGEGIWSTMQRAIECLWQAKVVASNLGTLLSEPAGYPQGVPPLRPHVPHDTFFYGISLGARSLVVYRRWVLDLPGINHWFRRWLMRMYFARYAPVPGAVTGDDAARVRD